VLVGGVSDCDGDSNDDSKLRFPGLETVHNKMNRLARVCKVQQQSCYMNKILKLCTLLML